MKYDTKRFGQIEVAAEEVIRFPEGPKGFPEYTEFAFIDKEEKKPFRTLQSLNDPVFAFVVINPLIVREDYQINVTLDDLKLVEANSIKNVEVYVIVSMHEEISNMTTNLQAPLIINSDKQIGHQFVFANTDYKIKEKFKICN